MNKRKHRPLPNLTELLQKYEYDPVNGGIFKIGDEHTEENCCSKMQRNGYARLHFKGQSWPAHRIAYYMFHRKDPGKKVIDHLNGDGGDNRIHNLRLCSYRDNCRNVSKKGKYVVDEDGCSRFISGIVPEQEPYKP